MKWPPPTLQVSPWYSPAFFQGVLLGRFKVNAKTQCHIWQGAKNKNGYGTLMAFPVVFGAKKPALLMAHRLAWYAKHGSLPVLPQMLCHKCDVRLCGNPEHLYVGTARTNMWDRAKRNRSSFLSRPCTHQRAIDMNMAKKLRKLFFGRDGAGSSGYKHCRSISGETQNEIARRLGISHGVITKYKQGGGRWRPKKLDASQVTALHEELVKAGLWSPGRKPEAKWTAASLADHFQISRSVVAKLLRNKTYLC